MILTAKQNHAFIKAINTPYTFLCWEKGSGRTLTCMHVLFSECLNKRGIKTVYIYPELSDKNYILDFALHVLDKSFHMSAQVSGNSFRFGNGSYVNLRSAGEFITQPFMYDIIVMDDTHKMDCDDPVYKESIIRAEKVERGREDIKRFIETRMKGA